MIFEKLIKTTIDKFSFMIKNWHFILFVFIQVQKDQTTTTPLLYFFPTMFR